MEELGESIGAGAGRPRVSLFRALKSVEARGLFEGWEVKQLIAYHVRYHSPSFSQRDCWILVTRGPMAVDTERLLEPHFDPGAWNHLRHFVDSATSEWLGSDSVPQPLEDRELEELLHRRGGNHDVVFSRASEHA